MKAKEVTIGTIVGLLAAATCLGQGISGTKHDFSEESWNSNKELCIVCHTQSNQDLDLKPKWNHQVSRVSRYKEYSSSTMSAIVGQPDGVSKLCLSCHDGSVAVENFGDIVSGTYYIRGSANLGSDLSNDHPVSFDYDQMLASSRRQLHNPATAQSGLGGSINKDLLIDGKMECTSCHDIHNKAGIPMLLVKDNSGSDLCLTCHNMG